MAIVESSIRPGEMKVDGSGVEAFRHRLSGVLVCPGDQNYEAACAVWNGMIDRRPALIAIARIAETLSKPLISLGPRASSRQFAAAAITSRGLRYATGAS